MFKNTFRLICFMTIALGYHSNNFAAQSSTQQENVVQEIGAQEDTFIKEFVESKNESLIEYENGILFLHVDLRDDIKIPLILMGLCSVLGLGCLLANTKYNEILFFAGILLMLANIVPTAQLYISAYKSISSPPLLAMNNEIIETCNKIKMKWADVKCIKVSGDNTVMLCDEHNIPLFAIQNNNLPIKFSELIAILGFYLKKYGKKNAPVDKETGA